MVLRVDQLEARNFENMQYRVFLFFWNYTANGI